MPVQTKNSVRPTKICTYPAFVLICLPLAAKPDILYATFGILQPRQRAPLSAADNQKNGLSRNHATET
ncbi:hypothetical protein VT06_13420 [Arsukibacterium sp. MJ3]|nr:hypothetical protein VT06_13420 [Arsukibacterium sp. MJ3]